VHRSSILLFLVIAVLAAVSLFLPSANPDKNATQVRSLVATIHPVAAILREIVGDHFVVRTLLSPAASPHTFDPKPADVEAAKHALSVVYVDPTLDGWAAKLSEKRIALFPLVDESNRLRFDPESAHVCAGHDHHHEHAEDAPAIDPHFWSDPVVVKSILPALVEQLSELAPDEAETFSQNAKRFSDQLDALHTEISRKLALHAAKPVFLFHPSLLYFLHRYGLSYGGAVEPFAGNSPGPKYLEDLIHRLRDARATAIFTEPQLSGQPARVIAAEVQDYPLRVFELDPIGGVPGRETYAELIRYNADTLVEAFE
jgi:zinc transport system substrate-binding protein